jgi:hypothetical protein
MTRREKFKIENYTLTVDDGSYLVEVAQYDDLDGSDSLSDLPAWVFDSRYAIWLSAGDAPVRVRALEGEKIKQEFLKQFAEI